MDIQKTMQTLAAGDAGKQYLKLLKTLAVVGVADTKQLAKVTNLARNPLARLVQKLLEPAGSYPPLMEQLDEKITRLSARGRAPHVYRLNENGAALLRAQGQSKARACELKDPTVITHALGILDVFFAAQQSDRPISVDQNWLYGEDKALRPDAVITLLDGTRALFEIEQAATPELIRRMCESLEHKREFFSASPGNLSSTVRMLIALPPGNAFDATMQVWQEAWRIVGERAKRNLPFRVMAQSLAEFLAMPDWGDPVDATRWVEVKPNATPRGLDKARTPSGPQTTPSELLRHSARDDALILKSLWRVYQEKAATVHSNVGADPAFFDVMRIIYIVSHDEALPVMTLAQFPYQSLYLLKHYLVMHSTLKKNLQVVLKRSTKYMSVPTTLKRMQDVIQVFLEYHGWRSYGPLQVHATLTDFQTEEPQVFGITVRIAWGLLASDPSEVMPANRQELTEKALGWVVWALFNYAPHLGFEDQPMYW